MKMNKLLIPILCGLFISTAANLHAQECLKYWDDPIDTTWSNPDSVMIDSCELSVTYGQLYAKKWFYIRFSRYVIDIPPAPFDSLVEVSWTAIDTAYSDLRSSFQTLEEKYGIITLKKYAPNWSDSTHKISSVFSMRFEHYACIDSVLDDLSFFNYIDEYYFNSYPVAPLSANHSMNASVMPYSIYPTIFSTSIRIESVDKSLPQSIRLINLHGNVVLDQICSSPIVNLDVSTIPSGVYWLSCDGYIQTVIKY